MQAQASQRDGDGEREREHKQTSASVLCGTAPCLNTHPTSSRVLPHRPPLVIPLFIIKNKKQKNANNMCTNMSTTSCPLLSPPLSLCFLFVCLFCLALTTTTKTCTKCNCPKASHGFKQLPERSVGRLQGYSIYQQNTAGSRDVLAMHRRARAKRMKDRAQGLHL